MTKFETIIVSNRLPVNVTKENGELQFEASSGGLATAMSSLEGENRMWVGWPGIDNEILTDEDREKITEEVAKYGCSPVFLSAKEIELFYEGYANDTLWPLFHYFQNVARFNDDYWQAYKTVNQKFADATAKLSDTNARIWIQDYHFMLLPGLLREQVPETTIGFFLHIPFPSFEIFRLLPERKEILRGLLGADIVGFHAFDYVQHFLDSCTRLLGAPVTNSFVQYDDRQVSAAVYPIGIDYKKFRAQLGKKETKDALATLNSTYKGQKLVLSVDRLDYSKGILERLETFRSLLEQYPEYHGKIKLLMVAVPSRTGVQAYQSLRDEIEKTVSRINGTFGTLHWAPISYQFQNRPFAEIVALYARADIMLVTPIRDGMNLVAKEYVASKKQRSGVLILSEMTGAIDELPESISINPNDTSSVVEALRTALSMPVAEQKERLATMNDRLKKGTVQEWGKKFMDDMTAAKSQPERSRKQLSDVQVKRMKTQFAQAKKRLIILDYDGTLRGFVKTPNPIAASPTIRIRRILKQLVDQPDTTVAVVSGRTKRALGNWFVGLPVELAAEHGAWRRTKGSKKWVETTSNFSSEKKATRKMMESYTERTKGAVIEEKDHAMVWHYAAVEPDVAYKRAGELKHELMQLFDGKDVSVHEGRNIIEVKPSFISKGAVVKELQQEYGADFVLCAGDDYTDEDMFKQLIGDRSANTIKVGAGETAATYRVETPSKLLKLLDVISERAATPALPAISRTLKKPLRTWFKKK